MRRLVIVLVVAAVFLLPFFVIRADELDDITQQLAALNEDLKSKQADYQKLSDQLDGIKSRVAFLEQEIVKKEKEVKLGEQTLEYQKKLLNERAKSYYKNISKNADSFLMLLVASDLSTSLQNFFYQKTVVDQDRDTIIKIVLYIKNLEDKKASLAREKTNLAAVQDEIDRQSKILAGEISTTQAKVAELSEKQQQLIAAKLASLNIPRSAYVGGTKGCSSDLTNGRDPGFSPKIGFFTFGAPHRNYMSQYGAKGRAEDGQSYTDILNFYYGGTPLSDIGATNIIINGTNEYNQTFNNESMDIEDYVKHLYEMPSEWPGEALRAQAIAARTYGLKIMRAHGSVLPNQTHQVVKKELNAQSWIDAVDQTKGKILGSGGEPILAEYSISHGGYIRNLSKYDGKGSNPGNFADLISNAYDKDSDWFYCDWGSRDGYGRTAWLKTSEVADIANVILLGKADPSTSSHLSQTDAGIPETWDAERVKSELKNRNRRYFNSVGSVSIGADFGSGITTSVTVSGDAGSESFSGDEFKRWFNARAPANIFINGPLYNAEIR